jgi:hypothetical protein
MPRGGYREGSGAKSTWLSGETVVIRVPKSLSDEVLRLTRLLDEGKTVDDVTKSKYLDLSGVTIRNVDSKSAVFLEDLLNKDFKIRPLSLVDKIRKQIDGFL